MQLFQINQSEESSKITINAHTPNCPLHELPITGVLLYVNFCICFLAEKVTYKHLKCQKFVFNCFCEKGGDMRQDFTTTTCGGRKQND